MMDRLEILAARLRRAVSRNRWSARLLGHRAVGGEGQEPGLVLLQVDGLGLEVLQKALEEGRMPFLGHLLADESHELLPLYTGLPSSTPGFQGEFFYGVRGAVPAFAYRDRELDRVVSMNDPTAAAAVEARLRERARGLLEGGSAWSDIFAGGAAEPHLCASTTGLSLVWQALNPLRAAGLVLVYGWSLARIVGHLLAETALAWYDLLRGQLEGKDLWAELRFVPTRVLVSAVMRELVTGGAAVDCERGLPVIQLNLLGYDEHAHRRGPDSRFARWTLKGIDRSLRRVWLAAHRSRRRDYQVWIYSDHGQEAVRAYPLHHPEGVGTVVRRIYERFELRGGDPSPSASPRPPRMASGAERGRWLAPDLPSWLGPRPEGGPPATVWTRDGRCEVVAQGPVGFLYPGRRLGEEETDRLAALVARDGRIPTVLVRRGEGAVAHRSDGRRFELPADRAAVFGPDHPFLDEVCADTLELLRHPDAAPVLLLGFSPEESWSLQLENGAHGGPGPRETTAFVLLPPEARGGAPLRGTLRPEDLRHLARRALTGATPTHRPPRREPGRVRLRLVSYNVHGCRGMDGAYSPPRIARVLARLRADIVCLQEVDQGRHRSGGVRQVQEIARLLEADFQFHAVTELDDGHFGNAVLSHHPLRMVDRGPLPALEGFPGLEERGVLWVEVDVEGVTLQVLNTHLSILERERRLQVEALLQPRWLGLESDGIPRILCGDLNTGPESWTCRRLGTVLRNVDEDVSLPAGDGGGRIEPKRRTWSGRLPLRRIDHVFVGGSLRAERVEVPRTRLTRVASDHLPLVVDLSLPAE